ncbi:hypothetical protein EZS27_031619 [termite gut metagenome]|uniref:Uncharacterized protein n=1 Tax=termite gut metagenome TaxID=433724 RepID=A0A5J4QBF7_9ZZZZ
MPKSISQQIMETRLKVALALDDTNFEDESYQSLRNMLLDMVHQTVLQLNRNSFVVKAVLREV